MVRARAREFDKKRASLTDCMNIRRIINVPGPGTNVQSQFGHADCLHVRRHEIEASAGGVVRCRIQPLCLLQQKRGEGGQLSMLTSDISITELQLLATRHLTSL